MAAPSPNSQFAPAVEAGKSAGRIDPAASPLALEPAPAEAMESHPAWPMISHLPVLLRVHVPLSGLRVRDVLALEAGQTLPSLWPVGENLPLAAGANQIAWGEFEVAGQHIALRLTRLA